MQNFEEEAAITKKFSYLYQSDKVTDIVLLATKRYSYWVHKKFFALSNCNYFDDDHDRGQFGSTTRQLLLWVSEINCYFVRGWAVFWKLVYSAADHAYLHLNHWVW